MYPTREAVFQFTPADYERAEWGNEASPNPAVGATLTYSLGAPAAGAKYVITVADGTGKKVRTLDVDQAAGLHRVNWDLKGDAPAGAPAGRQGGGGFGGRAGGPAVSAGRYTATLNKQVGETLTPIGKPQSFQVVPLPAIVK